MISGGGLYLIVPGRANFVKIGKTSNFASLRARYKTYYGEPMSMYLFSTDDPDVAEKIAHDGAKSMGAHYSNELYKKKYMKRLLKLLKKITGSEGEVVGENISTHRCIIC